MGLLPDSVTAFPDAGKLVRLAPDIAGKAPLSLELLTVDSLASATVPVKFPAGNAVKFAPLEAGSVAGKRASATVPVSLVASSDVILASGIVPVVILRHQLGLFLLDCRLL